MTHYQERIAEAILAAPRCPAFTPESGEPCDGLEGCEECLRLASEAVQVEIDKPVELYVTRAVVPRARAVVTVGHIPHSRERR